jgi:NAD(P)-dependent dehydrogenase (short-subunit alcohol dehydrogenase family)
MQVAIITGATRGIGHATARRFAQAGWQVVNIARGELHDFGALNVSVDLGAKGWQQRVSAALQAPLAGADRVCVVHNAARSDGGSVFEASAEILGASLTLNLLAPYQLNQLLRPALKPGSSLLFVGSTLSEKAVAGYAPYIISKHALVGLMRSTCQDLKGSGVHTACICPGFVDTPLLRERADEQLLQAISEQVTFGRLLEPDEIARVLLFCADNPAVNGAVLHANLGQIER